MARVPDLINQNGEDIYTSTEDTLTTYYDNDKAENDEENISDSVDIKIPEKISSTNESINDRVDNTIPENDDKNISESVNVKLPEIDEQKILQTTEYEIRENTEAPMDNSNDDNELIDSDDNIYDDDIISSDLDPSKFTTLPPIKSEGGEYLTFPPPTDSPTNVALITTLGGEVGLPNQVTTMPGGLSTGGEGVESESIGPIDTLNINIDQTVQVKIPQIGDIAEITETPAEISDEVFDSSDPTSDKQENIDGEIAIESKDTLMPNTSEKPSIPTEINIIKNIDFNEKDNSNDFEKTTTNKNIINKDSFTTIKNDYDDFNEETELQNSTTIANLLEKDPTTIKNVDNDTINEVENANSIEKSTTMANILEKESLTIKEADTGFFNEYDTTIAAAATTNKNVANDLNEFENEEGVSKTDEFEDDTNLNMATTPTASVTSFGEENNGANSTPTTTLKVFILYGLTL